MRRQNLYKLAFLAAAIGYSHIGAQAQTYQDWYPSSITAPSGLQYHCALTAMPRTMPGIPQSDRRFINHTYSMILKALQTKLIMLGDLYQDTNHSAAYSKYYYATADARKKISDEKAPPGLEQFQKDVLAALDLQVSFFKKGTQLRNRGKSMNEVMAIQEGHAASDKLQSAWGQMASRYPSWTPEMKDSIYHHLCALDLF